MVSGYKEIVELVDNFDPSEYATTRNYADGNVSRLSPYISRGVISTRFVFERLQLKYSNLQPFEKFIQELAWRDHWQRNWQVLDIDKDILDPQKNVLNEGIPKCITESNTGIRAIDDGIEELQLTGYMHNHMRMYLSSVVCNIGKYHWKHPAKWMYYHLLDGDWGSNALSWQWVAGTNSHKRYFANQENINRFFYTDQKGTFLDHSYEELENVKIPNTLKEDLSFTLETFLPPTNIDLDLDKPIVLYTSYNLDPTWLKDIDANRVLLLDPEHFRTYPVSTKVLEFIIDLSKNIEGIQVFSGSFDQLKKEAKGAPIHFKEHPFARSFEGIVHERDWLAPSVPVQNSFFKYWKKVKKHI